MAWEDILTELTTRVNAVTGGHRVYDFRRQLTKRADVETELKDTSSGRLSAWQITRDAEGLELISIGNAVGLEPFYHRTHPVFMLGIMALDDDATTDSETIFMKLVEDIVVELRQNNLLNEKVILPIDPQVPIIGHDTIHNVLVHRAEIRFPAIERVGG